MAGYNHLKMGILNKLNIACVKGVLNNYWLKFSIC